MLIKYIQPTELKSKKPFVIMASYMSKQKKIL
jgi:hypothetical protein